MNIDRYQVKRLLGQGAMGKVYLAVDPKIDRQVAIKVLSTGSADKGLRKRFRLEAKAIATLKHPNIVELYDYSGEEAKDLFLVMEYVPGLSLYHLVADRGPMSEATALAIGHELALALAHSHQHQVVHRDIKPENVLLHHGRVVLTDFGVVKAFSKENTLGVNTVHSHTQVLGTPGFMAPEQFTGTGLDPRTDIWGLGAVLYNLTTGRLPYEGQSIDEIFKRLRRGKFNDPRRYNPTLSHPFCQFLARCMQAKKRHRPADAAVVREQILELLAIHGVSEVRKELVSYEKNPTRHAEEQRERGIDVLLRDLKVALKDKDEAKARKLIERMQVLAPIDDRMNEITGVSFDARRQPVFARREQRTNRLIWIGVGIAIGTLFGAVAMTVILQMGLLPPSWVEALVRLRQSAM